MAISAVHSLIGTALLCAGVAGCTSVQPPPTSMSRAQLAIRAAEQNNAAQYAPVELRQARDKLQRAEQAVRNENYVSARRLGEEAVVDARLAEVTAESALARRDAAELQKAIKTLRAEIDRGATR